jgi:serine phosphatase RsbU (regulator of sigma subunit)
MQHLHTLKISLLKLLPGFLFFFSISIFAQNKRAIDSLQKLVDNAKEDTTKMYQMLKLSDEIMEYDDTKILQLSNAVLELVAKKLPTAQGILKKRLEQSYIYANNNIGYTYKVKGDYKKACDHYFKSIAMCESSKNDIMLSQIASNVGVLFKASGEPEKSLPYFLTALEAAKRANFKENEGWINSSIGSYYSNKRDTVNALKYFETALKIHTERDNKSGLGTVLNNIGFMYTKVKNFKRSLYYYHLSLNYKKHERGGSGTAQTLNNIGRSHYLLKSYDSALAYIRKAEQSIGTFKYPEITSTTEQLYWMIYSKQQKYKEALEHYQKYTDLNDSLNNSGIREQLVKADLKHDFEKKELILKVEQEKKDALAHAEARKQKVIILSVCGVLLLVLIFSIFIFRNYKEKQKINIQLADQNEEIHKQKELVEEKQKEIVDSINYAKQIQKTLLANHELVNQTIPDSFVMFQPKDIVSGDFYWATRKGNLFYLAVCDSTGHGVPGAFMSLLNISFLNEALNEKGLQKPNEIFDFVRDRLIANISQAGRKDGMDGILICIDGNGKITYAAANNGPLTISDGIVKEFPADKMPVGKGEKEDPFTLYELPIKKGDMLYLYTDGYADQFGGPKGKKFKYKQLDELLLLNFKLPVIEQENMLIAKFEEWKGKLEQVDDVCILGIRI